MKANQNQTYWFEKLSNKTKIKPQHILNSRLNTIKPDIL